MVRSVVLSAELTCQGLHAGVVDLHGTAVTLHGILDLALQKELEAQLVNVLRVFRLLLYGALHQCVGLL